MRYNGSIRTKGDDTMNPRRISIWLKIILAFVYICGAFVYLWVIPELGTAIKTMNPEFSYCYAPWLGFISITALPCVAGLSDVWRISTNIGDDRPFTKENARLLKRIAFLAAGDAAYFFAGNILFLFLNMHHPGLFIMAVAVVLVGIAIAMASGALSYLVGRAALLQEQSDLTI